MFKSDLEQWSSLKVERSSAQKGGLDGQTPIPTGTTQENKVVRHGILCRVTIYFFRDARELKSTYALRM